MLWSTSDLRRAMYLSWSPERRCCFLLNNDSRTTLTFVRLVCRTRRCCCIAVGSCFAILLLNVVDFDTAAEGCCRNKFELEPEREKLCVTSTLDMTDDDAIEEGLAVERPSPDSVDDVGATWSTLMVLVLLPVPNVASAEACCCCCCCPRLYSEGNGGRPRRRRSSSIRFRRALTFEFGDRRNLLDVPKNIDADPVPRLADCCYA